MTRKQWRMPNSPIRPENPSRLGGENLERVLPPTEKPSLRSSTHTELEGMKSGAIREREGRPLWISMCVGEQGLQAEAVGAKGEILAGA